METLSLFGDYFSLSVLLIDDHKDVWVASSPFLLKDRLLWLEADYVKRLYFRHGY